LWTLTAVPDQALSLLKKDLQPVTAVDKKHIAQLITDLDADDFTVREKASQELEKLGAAAEQALRKVLEGDPSAEVRRRVQTLLKQLDQGSAGGAHLACLRMLELLEQIDTPEAKQHLKTLAKGAPDAWLTQEAKEALQRLRRTREKNSHAENPYNANLPEEEVATWN
jgi:hypothetical protein